MVNIFKSPKKLIAEIHNEFDKAQDRLLLEADNLLKELNIETETKIAKKAERLSKLGFLKSIPVRWVKESQLVKTKERAETIRYYKQHYPFQKFLSESELERICKKYNLVFAPVNNYIKDVPETNLKEIENAAALKSEDKASDILFTNIIYGGDLVGMMGITARALGLPFRIDNFEATHFTEIDRYLKANYPQVANRSYICNKGEVNRVNKQGLFICAPQSHFDLKGLKKQGKYSFMNITITEVKDPIVFRYCRGGIQIITKWGLEASDEIVVNEKMN